EVLAQAGAAHEGIEGRPARAQGDEGRSRVAVRTSRRTCPALAIAAQLAVAALVTALDAGPASADPTDEEPADARIDPDYAAGRKAIAATDSAAPSKTPLAARV